MSVHVSVPANLEPPVSGGSSLAPQHKTKTHVISGFHRTSHTDAVAGIAFDGIRIGSGRVYGPGFYMTRTFGAQNIQKMMHYGQYLVRCEVDVTGFVCFDKAMAKRVWGAHYSLQDQMLRGYTDWTEGQKIQIEEWSKILDHVWSLKAADCNAAKKPRKVSKTIKYNRMDQYKLSSDVAKAVYKNFSLHTRFPGIVYTGRQDGACCLAYDLSRVKPLATLKASRVIEKGNIKTLPWQDLTCPNLARKLRPFIFLDQDAEKYILSLDILYDTQKGVPGKFEEICFKSYRSARTFYDKCLWMTAIQHRSVRRRIPLPFAAHVWADVAQAFITDHKIFIPRLHAHALAPYFYACRRRDIKYSDHEEKEEREKFQKAFAQFMKIEGFAHAYSMILIRDSLKAQRAAYEKLHQRMRTLKTQVFVLRLIWRMFQPFVYYQEAPPAKVSGAKKKTFKRICPGPHNPWKHRNVDCVQMVAQYCMGLRNESGGWDYNEPEPLRYLTQEIVKEWENAQYQLLLDFHEKLCQDEGVSRHKMVKAALDTWWQEVGHPMVWSQLKL